MVRRGMAISAATALQAATSITTMWIRYGFR
jgi:hypothetical protein